MSSMRKRGKTWTAQVSIAGWRSFTKTLEDKLKSVPIPDNNIENLKLKTYSKDIQMRYLLN